MRTSDPFSEVAAFRRWARLEPEVDPVSGRESQRLPADWCEIVHYAERFHVEPQDVERRVSTRWWLRLALYDTARRARLAAEKLADGADAVKDLTADERRLIDWAEREEDDGD